MTSRYRNAGVNIEAGDQFVERIAVAARATHRPEVLSGIGGFAAHFALGQGRYRDPVLVSCTDGVGTKLKIAIACHRYDAIGTDLVAMCVNDLACSGAEPLFFLDYFATGTLRPHEHAAVVEGIAVACQHVGCALIGGETAEMPGIYHGDDFDLAGFAVGIAERTALIDGTAIRPGDRLLGIASTGFHSNGYSLLRQICHEHSLDWDDPLPNMDRTVGDVLLEPTALYAPLVRSLHPHHSLHGIAHITGGGLTGNIPRVLPASCQARIHWSGWELPPLFRYFATLGNIDPVELRAVFNCGIGMVFVVAPNMVTDLCALCNDLGHPARVIGEIVARPNGSDPIIFV